MEIATWIATIETTLGLLYLAIVGQRSIAEWRRERTKARRREAVPETPAQARNHEQQEAFGVLEFMLLIWENPGLAFRGLVKAVCLLFAGIALLLGISAAILAILWAMIDSRLLGNVVISIARGAMYAGLISLGGLFVLFFVLFYEAHEQEFNKP